ncbi:MAG: 3-hydroxyacyl-CoA dehydrogenase NAD-binding domain-containing protein [Phycisphaerales bacterium]|nr:3-hydroxyacyl-CoA dehydrogenase NAD-binding domain-containing protein [Phycisphaerales bacterium]
MEHTIKTVTVIGAGTMGNGIAHTFAQYGFAVHLFDVQAEQLKKAQATIAKNLDRQVAKNTISADEKDKTLSRILMVTDINQAITNSDFVIEAASENEQVKLAIFKQLSTLCSKDVILATNTSSISITKIAAAVVAPERVIGMHFMNPVPMMKLVEIINGYSTKKEVTETVMVLCQQLQKTPNVVNDYPGFIANRILMPMLNEAIYSLFEGVAKKEEIDSIMKLGMGHPMGPLQLADFIGLDVCLSILQVLYQGFGNPKYAPCPLLVNMVQANKLGIKTGEGFYKYDRK